MNSIFLKLIILSTIMLFIDGFYLYFFNNNFKLMLVNIQNSPLVFNKYGAISCYILLIFGLYRFIIQPNKSLLDAYLLGLVMYGVYESTNYTTITKWQWDIALTDTLWGGFLFLITTFIYRSIFNIKIDIVI